MRIHRLEVTAFGPFAGPASVDLDALSDAGLFLLTGATGAGKTSILDAICFALYGAVPGDRQAAKRLRSDHAAPGVAPEVRLELTVAGRRLRIVRSPAWERPKRRGAGTTTEQARVLVEERVAGAWCAQATRLDEAGHLVSGLLGMNLGQFCQVQLLPQGRFQAFLRADSAERHDLLQKLFRTTRFEAVEAWLRDRRRRLRRAAAHHHDAVADLVSRTSEAAGIALPSDWDLHGLEPVADDLVPWVLAARERADDCCDDARADVDRASAEELRSRQEQQAGRRLRELQVRLEKASAEQATLLADDGAHRARRDRLEAAGRAAAVLPVLEAHDGAEAELAETAAATRKVLAEAAELLGVERLAEAEVRGHRQQAATRAADVRSLQPLVAERERLAARLADAAATRASLGTELGSVEAALSDLPHQVATARADEASVRRAGERLPMARQELAAADDRLAAGRLVAELVAERSLAEIRHHDAVDDAHRLKEAWLLVQERRLEGMAAEMAVGLVSGGCCPVCGSAEHPHPARPAPDSPDATAEREARRAVDDAELERHARAGAVRDLDTRIRHARERAGHHPVPVLEREAARAQAAVDRIAARASELPHAESARRATEQAQQEQAERRTDLLARIAALDTGLDEARQRVEAITEELDRRLPDIGATSVARCAEHLDRVEQACTRALDALEARSRAHGAREAAAGRAAAAVAAHGFDGAGDVRAAALDPDELAALTDQVREHEVRLAAVETLLTDPELQEAGRRPAPDLPALDRSREQAATGLAAARAAADRAVERAERLELLAGRLADAVSAWTPVRDDLDLTDTVASLADGTSPDNELRMRLTGFVLAYRLRQVVDAANERLVGMTDGRYLLEHTSDRGAGERRGGLSLVVRDDWTGELRDPVTLSGGETFVVSLALALGLADVISFEAGGVELDTLFVDEGFGTLDADTLDDVMDMLDDLRDGGRVVGVVSHVAELRDRIPTQLHVRKERTGSSVHHAAVG